MKKYELEANEENVKESLLNDKLGNQEYLCSIIRLLSNIKDNQVICVDGDWGVGKTFLVKQLVYLISHYNDENNKEVLKIVENEKDKLTDICNNNLAFYYNAWQNDDHNDPFSSIIYNILNVYPKYKNKVINKFEKEDFFKGVLKTLTKLLSNNLLNTDFNADYVEKIKTFEDLATQICTCEEKKRLFKELVDEILDNKRMILIIDELDRCNPKFAVKLLEVIKHFYDLKNITIIMVSNNKELQSTIKQQYGQDFSAYNYLNRFYDYIITVSSDKSIIYSKSYLSFSEQPCLPHDVFFAMIEKYKFTLRDCNKYRVLYDTAIDYIESKTRIEFFLSDKENKCIYSIILPIILSFKIKDIEAYIQCLNGETNKLEEAIYYLNKYFIKIGHEGWLTNFIDIKDDMEEIKEDYIIQKINDTFIKLYNQEEINKVFLSAIKVCL